MTVFSILSLGLHSKHLRCLVVHVQCSVTCGRGLKTRTVACVDDDNGQVVEDYQCVDRKKPRELAVCRRGLCPHWITSRWSQVCFDPVPAS